MNSVEGEASIHIIKTAPLIIKMGVIETERAFFKRIITLLRQIIL
jgi:hypothetical protein